MFTQTLATWLRVFFRYSRVAFCQYGARRKGGIETMAKPKQATLERIGTMLDRAVTGSRQLGLDDVANRYAEMSIEDYAHEKGISIIENPARATKSKRSDIDMENTVEIDAEELENLEAADDEAADATETLARIWELVVPVSSTTKKDELLTIVDEIAEAINSFDPEEFPFDAEDDADAEA